MSSEVRRVIDQIIPIINSIRDTQISLTGTTVLFKVPSTGTFSTDLYGDIVPGSFNNLSTEVIIKWGDYRTLLSTTDSSAEENLPLEVISKIKDNIPKGSTVDLSYLNQDNREVVRTFVVVGVEEVLEKNEIGRKLTLVPKRS